VAIIPHAISIIRTKRPAPFLLDRNSATAATPKHVSSASRIKYTSIIASSSLMRIPDGSTIARRQVQNESEQSAGMTLVMQSLAAACDAFKSAPVYAMNWFR
jgi:hypothetical protein